jgi:hypothetical protein
MRSIRMIIPALLAAAALLAGCGGGSDQTATFERDFKPVNARLLRLDRLLGRALQTAPQTPDAALEKEFSRLATLAAQAKRDTDALKPPNDLRPRVDALSAATAGVAKDLRDIAHSAEVKDRTKASEATTALLTDFRALSAARREIAKKTGAKVAP